MKKVILFFLAVFAVTSFSGCGYNSIQKNDEAVNAAHAQVLSVYKKRADLIPNLVETVKGYASHEKEVFAEVTTARANATQITLPANATPEQAHAFLEGQKGLQSSLSRLIAIAENHPQLKADQGFRDLQRQLEETETQATAVRNKYIRSIQAYNGTVRKFPTNITAWVFRYETKPQMQFEDEEEIKKSPRVTFN